MMNSKTDAGGHNLMEKLRRRRWWTLLVGTTSFAALIVIITAGFVLDNDARSSLSRAPASISVPKDACSNGSIDRLVAAALAEPEETRRNGLLAFPEEVPPEARRSQQATWDALSPQELAFQLCLHLEQEGPR